MNKFKKAQIISIVSAMVMFCGTVSADTQNIAQISNDQQDITTQQLIHASSNLNSTQKVQFLSELNQAIKNTSELRDNLKATNNLSNIKALNSVPYPGTSFSSGDKGNVIVTLDDSTGHAGVVVNSTTTIESFPSTGVRFHTNDWRTRYNSVIEEAVWDLSDTNRREATVYAVAQIGTPYNYNFANPWTTDSFYCSQLVWKAYKQQGVDLDGDGGLVVWPNDLTKSTHVTTVYKQG